jgi:hypothetical protein
MGPGKNDSGVVIRDATGAVIGNATSYRTGQSFIDAWIVAHP